MSVKRTSAAGIFTGALNNEETRASATEGAEAFNSLGEEDCFDDFKSSIVDNLKGQLLKGQKLISGLHGYASDYIQSGLGDVSEHVSLNVHDEKHPHHDGFLRLVADLGLMSGRLDRDDHMQITGINGRDIV